MVAARAPAPGCWSWLLLDSDQQGEAVRRLLAPSGFVDVATFPDLAGLDRCTEGRLAGR